jgi:photosystem II stability/assembly factor-like uncharacterized protein
LFQVPATDALMASGDGSWYWQLPQPQGNYLLDVAQAGGRDVWAVGEAGVIVHSADGGISWTSRRLDSYDADLTGVAFLSTTEGWAAGPGMLHTKDGGATWQLVRPSGSSRLSGIWFADSSCGWTWGGRNVLRTRNGGKTWRLNRLPKGVEAVSASFVSRSVGFVGCESGYVWRTKDGGATWSRVGDTLRADRDGFGFDLDAGLRSVSFWDGRHGLATICRSGSREGIVRTLDGGRTWSRVGQSNCFDLSAEVAAVGRREAWVIGRASDPLGGTAVMHSEDRGTTWATRLVCGPVGATALSVQGDSMCAVARGILTSADGGRTWARRTSGDGYAIEAMDMAARGGGWAVGVRTAPPRGDAGVILRTLDGVSWREQAADAKSTYLQIEGGDGGSAWVLRSEAGSDPESPGELMATRDGGATWSSLAGAEGHFDDMSLAGADHGWLLRSTASGADMIKTADGGVSWVTHRVLARYPLTGIFFLDAEHGWVCGGTAYPPHSGSSVLSTTDSGQSWREVFISKVGIEGVAFGSPLAGCAWGYDASERPVVVHTTDGGLTWSSPARLGRDYISDVAFEDPVNAYAVVDGSLFRSDDGASSWSTASTGSKGLWSVACAQDHVWCGGVDGILSTLNTVLDVAPPSTTSDGDHEWHRSNVIIRLLAVDIGDAGLGRTEYQGEDGIWKEYHPGEGLEIQSLPETHGADGVNWIRFRSIDNMENVEAVQACLVKIDTRAPAAHAFRPEKVARGEVARIHYRIDDARPGSSTAQVLLRIDDVAGRAVKRVSLSKRPVGRALAYDFRCNLSPGRYRIVMQAIDEAGNRQTSRTSTRLMVYPAR